MLADNSLDLAYRSLSRIFTATSVPRDVNQSSDLDPIVLLSKHCERLQTFSDSSFRSYVNKQINISKEETFMISQRNKDYYPGILLPFIIGVLIVYTIRIHIELAACAGGGFPTY